MRLSKAMPFLVTLILGVIGYLEWSRSREVKRLQDAFSKVTTKVDESAGRSALTNGAVQRIIAAASSSGIHDTERAVALPAAQSKPPGPKPVEPEEFAVRIDDAFRRESTDSTWIRAATDQLSSKLQSYREQFAIEIKEVVCHSSMCRFRVNFPDPKHFHDFLGEFGSNGRPWNSPMYAHIENADNGEIVSSCYLARDGSQLPQFYE